jgi:hypothetical protein
MSRLEHPLSPEELLVYADGEIQNGEAAKVADHLDVCPHCASLVAEAKQMSAQLRSWEIEQPSEQFDKRVMAELYQERQPAIERKRKGWTLRRTWVYGLSGVFAAGLLLLVTVIPQFFRSRQAMPAISAERMEPAIGGGTALAPTTSVQQASGPMVTRTINLRLVTKDFDAARARIDQILQQSQGYIDRLAVRSDSGSARNLTATLRFPAGRSQDSLSQLKNLGSLLEESQSSSDITSQYVDLAARLSNARNSEQRLLALMRERTGTLKDVVEVEHEIASVRETIERMEAQLKDLNNKVEFVTIQLELSEQYHAELQPSAPSTRTELRNAAIDGIRSAGDNVVAIVLFLLRYGPALLIWFAVLAAVLAILLRMHRVELRRRS